MKNILGIDPGLSGAISLYDGNELLIWDMPTLTIERNGKMKRQLDLGNYLEIFRNIDADHCYLESVNAMPGQGVTSMFSMGRTFGAIECGLVALGIPYTPVSSMKWKKDMQCPKEKDGARLRASQLLPDFKHNWDLKKHDGRAESALIALWGWQKCGS